MACAATGLVALMTGGVVAALLAARWLEPSDYTVFAAFSAVLGLLVLGPASSLEQESALRASHTEGGLRSLTGQMARRAIVVWLLAAILITAPVAHWQGRLWGSDSRLAQALLVLSIPPIFLLAICRGIAAARRAYGFVATVYAVTGIGMVLFPLILHQLGLPVLRAFLFGAVAAWVPPLLALTHLMRVAAGPPETSRVVSKRRPDRLTAWIVAGNVCILGNLLAVPAVLRWHVDELDVAVIADSQLLVSISRLSTTAALGFLPLVIARVAVGAGRANPHVPRRLMLAAFGVGMGTVTTCTLLGDRLVALVVDRPTSLTMTSAALAALPVLLLCPTIVLTGLAMANGHHRLVLGSWAAGLVALVGVTSVDSGGRVEPVLAGVLLASCLPLALLASIFTVVRSARSKQ